MLTAKGKYSLKALVHLAGLKPGETAQAVAIAEAHNIPKKFLDAILGDLLAAGIVYSRKGPGGGYMAMPRISQAREGPAPTISVKNATPMPISSRVSPRLNASRFDFCSSRSFL